MSFANIEKIVLWRAPIEWLCDYKSK